MQFSDSIFASRFHITKQDLEGYLGEALSQLLCHFPAYRERITQVGDVIAFRNQIVHGYATVQDDIVWEIVQSHLPRLRKQADELLGELDPLRQSNS